MMQSSNSGSGSGSSNASNSSSSAATTVVQPSAQISTTQDSDFWNDLNKALTSIVGSADGRAVIVNGGSGVVLIKAFPADLRNVENYLKMTQLIVERQVMLEAKILEVGLSEEFQAGVNWSSFGSGGKNSRYAVGAVNSGTTLDTSGAITSDGLSVNPGSLGSVAASSLGKGLFGLVLQTANFAALLNFLETQGNVQVLSSPRIATINNQKAVLKVGTDDYYVTGVTSSSSTSNSNGSTTPSTPTINLQPFFSGISLDVTPQIDGENNVVLHVHPSISTVTEKQKVVNLGTLIGTYTLPLASSTVNETDSIVRVQDGNIVAIGGLMKQKQASDANGLPGSTASSSWGLLLGARNSVLQKSELVILIKPTIIRNDSSWKDDLIDTQGRVQQLDPRLARPQTEQ
jgi:MSHA biogenesis protein MshL